MVDISNINIDSPAGTAGRTVGNRYTLHASVGAGGMGTVWRAYDELLRREVAVKEVLISPGLPQRERDLLGERTLREARAAAALNHSSVVRVYDVVQDQDRPWIIMELLRARSIAEIVKDDGPMPVRQVAEIGLAVLGALEAAHRAGVLHRDVKPGNVLICDDDRVVLTDFGVARSPNETPLTSTGLLLGSPQYIAPERARGRSFGPPSDLFSLGATLYAAVEGRPPFDRGEPLPTMTAVVCEEPDPMSMAGPLASVLTKLLEKDPDRRPDASVIRSDLRMILAANTPAQVAKRTELPSNKTPTRLASDTTYGHRHRRNNHHLATEQTRISEHATANLPRPRADVLEPTLGIGVSRDRNTKHDKFTNAPVSRPTEQTEAGLPRRSLALLPAESLNKSRTSLEPTVAAATGETHISWWWAHPRFLIGVVAILMVIASVGAYTLRNTLEAPIGNFRKLTNSESVSKLAPYTDPSGYSLQVPAAWEQEVVSQDWVEFRAPYDDVQLRVHLTHPLASGTNAQNMAHISENYQLTKNNRYKRISLKETKAGQYPAAVWDWTYYKNNSQRHVRTVIVVVRQTSYEITLSAPIEKFKKYEPMMKSITDSFKL